MNHYIRSTICGFAALLALSSVSALANGLNATDAKSTSNEIGNLFDRDDHDSRRPRRWEFLGCVREPRECREKAERHHMRMHKVERERERCHRELACFGMD